MFAKPKYVSTFKGERFFSKIVNKQMKNINRFLQIAKCAASQTHFGGFANMNRVKYQLFQS